MQYKNGPSCMESMVIFSANHPLIIIREKACFIQWGNFPRMDESTKIFCYLLSFLTRSNKFHYLFLNVEILSCGNEKERAFLRKLWKIWDAIHHSALVFLFLTRRKVSKLSILFVFILNCLDIAKSEAFLFDGKNCSTLIRWMEKKYIKVIQYSSSHYKEWLIPSSISFSVNIFSKTKGAS